MHRALVTIVLTLSINVVIAKSDTISELYKITVSVKKCLANKYPGVCLKERALEAINETIFLDEPIMIGYIRIEKNDQYDWNRTKNSVLPSEANKRSLILNDALYDKLKEFFKSRTIKLNVDEAIEGRKGKGGGGGGGGGGDKGGGGGKAKGVMLAAVAGVCMYIGVMVGKMGMMAMGAMMMSKVSLLLSALVMLKKSKGDGGGGGEEKEKQIKIIYASTGGGGGGGDYGKGGGGGYHRRLSYDPQTITYRAHVPQDVNGNVVYEGY